MDRNYPRHSAAAQANESPPSEARLFAQALLGKTVPNPFQADADARAYREQVASLADLSPEHERRYRSLLTEEARQAHEREHLQWLAEISPRHEVQLRSLRKSEAETRHARERWSWLAEDAHALEAEWDPAKHPRRGAPPNAGWFVSTGSSDAKVASQSGASDPSRWYLPADDKGSWTGPKGDSSLRLNQPLDVDGKLVHEIEFRKGVPVLDKFAQRGKTVSIVLTGDSKTDIRNAKAAWLKLNPGKTLPRDSIFHHDLLHVVEETVTIDGKKTKVLVGKMHLVPESVNKLVFHEGSASVARKFYGGLDINVGSVKRLAKKEASLAGKANGFVARAARKIAPGKIAKGVLPFLGRNVVRAIPIVGTGLAILDFAENAEAHGVGGAAVRAVPVLGDLISAHDLGSDLAKQIRDDAEAESDAHYRALNAPVAEAWDKASQQTIETFHELAPQIQVTNVYGPNGRVDPHEVADALKDYRQQMQRADLLRVEFGDVFDFDAAASRARQELKQRLTKACQKDAPPDQRPAFLPR